MKRGRAETRRQETRSGGGGAIVVLVIAALCVAGGLHARARDEAARAAKASASALAGRAASNAQTVERRVGTAAAVVEGCVVDAGRAAIAKARVCASIADAAATPSDSTDATCTETRDDGCYSLQVAPSRYTVAATAPGYTPTMWSLGSLHTITVADGDTRVGIDFVLAGGGAIAQGIVLDYLDRPVGGATVEALVEGVSVTTQSDAQGAFTLPVVEGDLAVRASAPGYAPAITRGHAPGRAFDLHLDAESVLVGHVVDASSRTPAAAAAVCVDLPTDVSVVAPDTPYELEKGRRCARSDAEGKYRIDRLPMGRYRPTAFATRRRGVASESVHVGFGETSRELVIELNDAFMVSGRVMIEGSDKSCSEGSVYLHGGHGADVTGTITPTGAVTFDAVAPGSYAARIECPGFVGSPTNSSLVVAGDVVDRVWSVRPTTALRGIVVDERGVGVSGAEVRSRRMTVTSDRDGHFTLDDVGDEGKVTVSASGFASTSARWSALAGRTPRALRIVLPPGATIIGDVVDRTGNALANVTLTLSGGADEATAEARHGMTDERGVFTLRGASARATSVHATARSGSTTEAPLSFVSGVATVHLVLDTDDGSVRGRVLDADGAPVVEATVRILREDPRSPTAASAALRAGIGARTLTRADGSFAFAQLAKGTYSVRAESVGREAVASSVASESTIKLTLHATRRVVGVVTGKGGAPATEFKLEVTGIDATTLASERFFSANGAFSIDALPAVPVTVTATATDATATASVSLVDDDATGVELVLIPQSHLRGRLVWMESGGPIEAMTIGGAGAPKTTDSDGAFDLVGLAPGLTTLYFSCAKPDCYPGTDRRDFAERTVRMPPEGSIDLGTLALPHSRLTPGQRAGLFGFRVDRVPIADSVGVVVHDVITGTAAESGGLLAGDVITAIDGFEFAHGDEAYWPLATAPAGTSMTFTLARGAVLTLVSRARQ